jgi:hypothetical protein
MQKLKLDCDRLTVESFPTSAEETDGVGTVHARGWLATVNAAGCNLTTLLRTNPTCCPCTP